MATSTVVQGESPMYSVNGSVITNNAKYTARNNLFETAADMRTANVNGLNMLVVSATASAASGVNFFEIPEYATQVGTSAISGVSYSGINVTSTGTVTGVGILFPSDPQPGQIFKLMFDTAVTTLTLKTPTGYTIANPATSATANEVLNFALIGSVWKSA